MVCCTIAELAYNNSLRTGATTDSVVGALTYTFGDWYIQPTAVPTFDLSANGRTPPPDVGGRARISSFNVLNYFNQACVSCHSRITASKNREAVCLILHRVPRNIRLL